jgi:hypothetical protein
MNRIHALIKKMLQMVVCPFHHVKMLIEGTIYAGWALTRYQMCWHLDLGLLSQF